MIIYLIPFDTGQIVISTGMQVSNCRTNERQSVDWTMSDITYRECKIPLGTGFTEPKGRAIRCDP
jgi:hypothetical protein